MYKTVMDKQIQEGSAIIHSTNYEQARYNGIKFTWSFMRAISGDTTMTILSPFR